MVKKLNSSVLDEIKAYTYPKLHTGKEWYISFSAYDPAIKAMKRKRIKMNSIKDKKARRSYAMGVIDRLLGQLANGWNPWIEDQDPKAYVKFKEACDNYRRNLDKQFKDNLLREDSYVSYLSYLRNLIRYNEELKDSISYVYQFNRDYCSNFLDYIYIDRENSPQTRDNYLTWLRVFARYLVRKGYHKTAATEGIDMFGKRSHKKKRETLSEQELLKLKEYVSAQNKHYLLACYIIFYCLIRPKEMSLIKINDISVKNRTLFIPEDNSKNRKPAVVTINPKVIELMLDLGIFNYPGDYYLFGASFMPNKEHHSEKQFRDFWLKYVRKNLHFREAIKFYSLKDTGITLMLRSRIDNISVRDQARHGSILMTDIYTPHDIQQANPIIEKFESSYF